MAPKSQIKSRLHLGQTCIWTFSCRLATIPVDVGCRMCSLIAYSLKKAAQLKLLVGNKKKKELEVLFLVYITARRLVDFVIVERC